MTTSRDMLSLPPWAVRIRREREARNLSVTAAARALIAHATADETKRLPSLPDTESRVQTLRRRWFEWEAGSSNPNEGEAFYAPIVARMFGTSRYTIWPEANRGFASELIAPTGMETAEILTRMQRSDIDDATLDTVRRTIDLLCSEYPYADSAQLVREGRTWLRRVEGIRSHRLSLSQYREVLVLAGWLALLVGCVENDMGQRSAAEQTRKMALSIGLDTGHAEIVGWAYELRAWFALTDGDYRGVLEAAQAGTAATSTHGVSVQLLAQQAKAWARLGDRRQMEVSLDRARQIMDTLPYPDNLDHHFVVEPSKLDFYAMDCYRIAAEPALAENYADEVIRTSTAYDGTERKPMRIAEAQITLGVLAGCQGEVERAVDHGRRALAGDRQSLPSLSLVSTELGQLLQERYPTQPDVEDYLEQLRELRSSA